ncbi:Hsp70 family protein [Pirellulales bacterium]|nr:Hsp70 family protein [Pirellulales bacterium]
MDVILGIDLGTTNSVVSVLQEGQAAVLAVEGDAKVLPSAVGLDDAGELLVGTPARNQAVLGPERTILSVKRRMGEEARLALGKQELSPQEISAILLRTLKERAEEHLGRPATKAVITVPAFFNDNQRQATREAGELAGLEVVRLINEPTAAALTYEVSSESRKRILVYDLGGGTLDVSIVQIEQGVVEVLSSHGDTQLGGDDFDQLLLDFLADAFQEEHGVDLREIPAADSRLRRAAEAAKKELSTEVEARIEEAFLAQNKSTPLHLAVSVDRTDYEELIRPLVERSIDSVDHALEDAGLNVDEFDEVVLVGGSTRTPLVQEVVAEKLGRTPRQSVDPDLCVSMGAAIQGGLVQGIDVGPVLVDITPHTLGVRCLGLDNGVFTDRHFSRLIPRNSALPAKRSHVFYTNHPGQKSAEFEIYQGEHSDATLNKQIGVVLLEGLDPEADAGSEVVVRFHLSVDGTLRATVVERVSGLETSAAIDNAISRFQSQDRADARRRIDGMFGNAPERPQSTTSDRPPESAARDEQAAELPPHVRARMQRAAELTSRAERLLPLATAEDQQEIAVLLDQLRSPQDEADLADQSAAADKLEDLLFYLQDA